MDEKLSTIETLHRTLDNKIEKAGSGTKVEVVKIHGELKLMNSTLCNFMEQTDTNFKKIHERQDKTNGNVSENRKWIHLATGGLIVVSIIISGIVIPLVVSYIR